MAPSAREQVEHQHETQGCDAGTQDGQSTGSLAVADPEEDHDRGGRGVLDQDRRSDLHVLHGREVHELRAGHGDRSVHDHEAEVAAQHVSASPESDQSERRQDDGSEPHAHQRDRPGTPARVEQPPGQGSGEAEGDRRDDREGQSRDQS
jgi:hypothetical protein